MHDPSPRLASGIPVILAVLVLALGVLLPASSAAAATVGGIVTCSGTELEGATVQAVRSSNQQTAGSSTTDATGAYSISGLSDDTYDLVVDTPGGSACPSTTVRNVVVTGTLTNDIILTPPAGGTPTLSGRVTGYQGLPVTNVQLRIRNLTTGISTFVNPDADGRYSATLNTDSYEVRLRESGTPTNAPQRLTAFIFNLALAADLTLDFPLPVVRVTGVALGSDTNAHVPGTFLGMNGSANPLPSSLDSLSFSASGLPVDETGAFDFFAIAGDVNVTATPGDGTYLDANLSQTLPPGDVTLPALVLQKVPLYTLAGTVTGYQDLPVTNLQLRVRNLANNTSVFVTMDASGQYALSVKPGNYELRFRESGTPTNAPQRITAFIFNLDVQADTTIDLPLPVTRLTGFALGSDTNAHVPGTFLGMNGSANPLPSPLDSLSFSASGLPVDGMGAFDFFTIAGDVNVTATPGDGTYLDANLSQTTAPGDVTLPTLVLQKVPLYTLSGTVTGHQGLPVQNLQLRVRNLANNTSVFVNLDASGQYALSVKPGNYELRFRESGTPTNAPQRLTAFIFNLDVQADTTIDLPLPAASLSGTVSDSNGVPVPGVRIQTSSSPAPPPPFDSLSTSIDLSTDGDGKYSTFVLPGQQTFTFTPPQNSRFDSLTLPRNVTGDLQQRLILQLPDVSAPVIVAGPTVVYLSDTSVAINWVTDKPSTSRVEHEIVGDANVPAPLEDGSFVTRHSLAIQGLPPSTATTTTTVRYLVSSTDAAGNGPTESALSTFDMRSVPDTTPPVITVAPVAGSLGVASAIVTWVTDKVADGVVEHALSVADLTGAGPSFASATAFGVFVRDHAVAVGGLAPTTTYFARVRSTDPSGNAVTSGIFSFTTLDQPDVTAPSILAGGPATHSITTSQIAVIWTTDELSDSGVSYETGGQRFVARDPTLTRDHSVVLTGLAPGTAYSITVSSTDVFFNGPALGGPVTAMTETQPDTTPPAISGVVASARGDRATIAWTTDSAATSDVFYGDTQQQLGFLDRSVRAVDLETAHAVEITNLAPLTTYFYAVRSVDASGNEAIGDVLSFTTEAADQAPVAFSQAGAAALATGNDAPLPIVLAGTDPEGDPLTFYYLSAPAGGTLSGTLPDIVFTPSGAFAGTASFTFQVFDGLSYSAPATVEIVVSDTTPPAVTCPAAPATASATSAAGAVVTFGDATGQDGVDGPIAATCSPASGSTFPLGTTTVTCTATDAAGNTDSCTFDVTVEDTTAPVVACSGDLTIEATSASGAIATFSAQAVDAVDGAVTATCTPASGTTFPFGTTTVMASATDAAGNTDTCSFTVTVEDTTGPALACPADVTVEATSASGATVTYPAATATDISGVTLAYSIASGSVFPIGATTVTVMAKDGLDNPTSCSFTVTVTDTTPPAVSCPASGAVEATSAAGAIVTFGTASASDAADLAPAIVCSPASGSVFPLGVTTVTASATDAAGNTGSCTFAITVVDTTAPAVFCPPDVLLEATSPAGALAAYGATSATDAVSGAPALSFSPPAGSTLPLGATTVTVTATDAAGNASHCTFAVTVADTTPPVLEVDPTLTVRLTGESKTLRREDLPAPRVRDAASPASAIAVTIDAPAELAAGTTTTVTYRAVDAAGNETTATQSVEVLAGEAPRLFHHHNSGGCALGSRDAPAGSSLLVFGLGIAVLLALRARETRRRPGMRWCPDTESVAT